MNDEEPVNVSRLLTDVNTKINLNAQAMRVLESLTPGGSEFHDSPENCARWVRGRLASVVKEVEKRKAAEAERDALLYACASARTWLGERPDENDTSKLGVHYDAKRALIDQLDSAIEQTRSETC